MGIAENPEVGVKFGAFQVGSAAGSFGFQKVLSRDADVAFNM